MATTKQLNTDYLKFDAESMKKFIVQKLSENNNFTDQVFQDSNLTTLIDVFAYMFETFMFNLNNSASESIFSDTKLYENMNRIVKLLGYNPFGYITPITQCVVKTKDSLGHDPIVSNSKFLPKYTYIQVPDITDSTGKNVYYSIVNYPGVQVNLYATQTSGYTLSYDQSPQISFYNGQWKLYDQTFISTGIPYEEFTLDAIDMTNPDKPVYLAHPYVDVYVKRNDEYIRYTALSNGTLLGSGISIVGPKDKVFELRLNEYKQYALKFGDGIHGAKLQQNDELYIVYLQSNGKDGVIGAGIIDTVKTPGTLQFGVAGLDIEELKKMIGYTNDQNNLFYMVQGDTTDQKYGTIYDFDVVNNTQSTLFTDLETVDSMRFNAPEYFKTGGRLVTTDDYNFYMKKTYKELIEDVYTMNNWEYMSSFMFWLYKYNALNEKMRQEYFPYADSADFNNIYIWTKWYIQLQRFDNIEKDLFAKKTATSEPIILNCFDTLLIPCLNQIDASTGSHYPFDSFDVNCENFIEVVKDKNSMIPAELIKNNVINMIKDYFDIKNCTIGMTVNVSSLYDQLLLIDGVKEIRTGYLKTGDHYSKTVYYNGLSFALWTTRLINGTDLSVFNGNYKLMNFQFPKLVDDSVLNLSKRVKVSIQSFGQPNTEF